MLKELTQIEEEHKLTSDYKYYILLCSLFNSSARNIVKYWPKHHDMIINMCMGDGDQLGQVHLLQALCQFFVKKEPTLIKFAGTFMHHLYEKDVYEEEFLKAWNEKKERLDKNSILYSKKCERKFKEAI